MNNDLTKCTNEKCEIKATCYRYRCNPSEHQSYAMFDKYKKDCKYFISNKK